MKPEIFVDGRAITQVDVRQAEKEISNVSYGKGLTSVVDPLPEGKAAELIAESHRALKLQLQTYLDTLKTDAERELRTRLALSNAGQTGVTVSDLMVRLWSLRDLKHALSKL